MTSAEQEIIIRRNSIAKATGSLQNRLPLFLWNAQHSSFLFPVGRTCLIPDRNNEFAGTGFRQVFYFPTQNREKILCVISSRTVWPVISPMASIASSVSVRIISGV